MPNAFPVLSQYVGSTETQVDIALVTRARSGTVHIRRVAANQPREFIVMFKNLTLAQKQSIQTFYTANRTIPFTFVWIADGVTYTVLFGDNGLKWISSAIGKWDITLTFLEST